MPRLPGPAPERRGPEHTGSGAQEPACLPVSGGKGKAAPESPDRIREKRIQAGTGKGLCRMRRTPPGPEPRGSSCFPEQRLKGRSSAAAPEQMLQGRRSGRSLQPDHGAVFRPGQGLFPRGRQGSRILRAWNRTGARAGCGACSIGRADAGQPEGGLQEDVPDVEPAQGDSKND